VPPLVDPRTFEIDIFADLTISKEAKKLIYRTTRRKPGQVQGNRNEVNYVTYNKKAVLYSSIKFTDVAETFDSTKNILENRTLLHEFFPFRELLNSKIYL
jgi:hypothetical protein